MFKTSYKKFLSILIGVAITCAVVVPFVMASAPTGALLPLRGIFTKPDSTVVADGQHSVVFRLYDVSNVQVWSETQTVNTTNGVYSTSIPQTGVSFETAGVDFSNDYYSLSFQVDAYPETAKSTIYPEVVANKSLKAKVATLATTAVDTLKLGGTLANLFPSKTYLDTNYAKASETFNDDGVNRYTIPRNKLPF